MVTACKKKGIIFLSDTKLVQFTRLYTSIIQTMVQREDGTLGYFFAPLRKSAGLYTTKGCRVD